MTHLTMVAANKLLDIVSAGRSGHPHYAAARQELLLRSRRAAMLLPSMRAATAALEGLARDPGVLRRYPCGGRMRHKLPTWARIVRESLSAYEAGHIASTDGLVRSPADVYALLNERAQAEEVEVFYVLVCNSAARILAVVEVSRGILNSALVHPREVFRLAIAYGAAGIIVAHNHPSGDPTPSPEDRAVTRQLVDAGRIIGIPLYDHVVIGGGHFTSFAESGLL